MQHVVNPAPVERASDCSGVTDIWKDRIIQRNSTFTCTLRMQLQPQLPWESNLTSLKLSTMWLRLLFTLWLVNTWFPLMRQSNSSHQVYIECFKLKTYWILIKKKYIDLQSWCFEYLENLHCLHPCLHQLGIFFFLAVCLQFATFLGVF